MVACIDGVVPARVDRDAGVANDPEAARELICQRRQRSIAIESRAHLRERLMRVAHRERPAVRELRRGHVGQLQRGRHELGLCRVGLVRKRRSNRSRDPVGVIGREPRDVTRQQHRVARASAQRLERAHQQRRRLDLVVRHAPRLTGDEPVVVARQQEVRQVFVGVERPEATATIEREVAAAEVERDLLTAVRPTLGHIDDAHRVGADRVEVDRRVERDRDWREASKAIEARQALTNTPLHRGRRLVRHVPGEPGAFTAQHEIVGQRHLGHRPRQRIEHDLGPERRL